MSGVTQLLQALKHGQPQAAEALLPLVYDERRKLARSKLQHEQPGHTLEATALVHEAYVRLVGDGKQKSGDEEQPWEGRGHFFAAAAEAMRRILVESARRKRRVKRGGDLQRQCIDDEAIAAPEIDGDLIELDAALDKLAAQDPRKAELVKLRYFAGLTIEQAAAALEISTTTADRDWTYARAWLFRELSQGNR
jgi:RNA polymerase sigma factor (TIGR02999 family)